MLWKDIHLISWKSNNAECFFFFLPYHFQQGWLGYKRTTKAWSSVCQKWRQNANKPRRGVITWRRCTQNVSSVLRGFCLLLTLNMAAAAPHRKRTTWKLTWTTNWRLCNSVWSRSRRSTEWHGHSSPTNTSRLKKPNQLPWMVCHHLSTVVLLLFSFVLFFHLCFFFLLFLFFKVLFGI